MTKQQRQKLFEYMLQEHDVTLLDGDFAEISNIIHPPIFPFTVYPDTTDTAHIATTEPDRTDAWDIAQSILDKCNCAHIYISRKRIDPNCRWCEFHVDFIQAMRLFADQKVKKAVEATTGTIKPFLEYSHSSVPSDTADGWNEYRYAKQLAVFIHSRCYPEVPQWEPLPDLMGLLTQIDNMVCGLERKLSAPSDTAECLESALAFLLNKKNAGEYEDANDEVTDRWAVFASIMRRYAAKEVKKAVEAKEGDEQMIHDKWLESYESIKDELTEANKRIAELERQIDKITGSNPITLK